MIRVTVAYPNEPGKKFDWDYYLNSHGPMLNKQLGNRGLVKSEVDKGISGPDPSEEAPFVAIAFLTFNTVEEVHEAFKAAGREIMGDIPNFTDIKPTFQISEIVV